MNFFFWPWSIGTPNSKGDSAEQKAIPIFCVCPCVIGIIVALLWHHYHVRVHYFNSYVISDAVDSENEGAASESKTGKEVIDFKEVKRIDLILASLQRKVTFDISDQNVWSCNKR